MISFFRVLHLLGRLNNRDPLNFVFLVPTLMTLFFLDLFWSWFQGWLDERICNFFKSFFNFWLLLHKKLNIIWNCEFVNPFYAKVLFLYLPNTLENQRFSDVFRVYRNGTFGCKGLMFIAFASACLKMSIMMMIGALLMMLMGCRLPK